MTAIFLCSFTINRFFVPLWIFANSQTMETLFDRITHWKDIGEWKNIKTVFTSATTLERYYNITVFVRQHKAKFGYRYREKILADETFIERFGYLDLEYLKNAIKTMQKKLS